MAWNGFRCTGDPVFRIRKETVNGSMLEDFLADAITGARSPLRRVGFSPVVDGH